MKLGILALERVRANFHLASSPPPPTHHELVTSIMGYFTPSMNKTEDIALFYTQMLYNLCIAHFYY